MRSILEEFAYGNITPNQHSFKKNSPYGEALHMLAQNEEKLLEQLSGENRETFRKCMEAQAEVNRLAVMLNLVYGFKLGLLMTAEAFLTSDNLVSGWEEW